MNCWYNHKKKEIIIFFPWNIFDASVDWFSLQFSKVYESVWSKFYRPEGRLEVLFPEMLRIVQFTELQIEIIAGTFRLRGVGSSLEGKTDFLIETVPKLLEGWRQKFELFPVTSNAWLYLPGDKSMWKNLGSGRFKEDINYCKFEVCYQRISLSPATCCRPHTSCTTDPLWVKTCLGPTTSSRATETWRGVRR